MQEIIYSGTEKFHQSNQAL